MNRCFRWLGTDQVDVASWVVKNLVVKPPGWLRIERLIIPSMYQDFEVQEIRLGGKQVVFKGSAPSILFSELETIPPVEWGVVYPGSAVTVQVLNAGAGVRPVLVGVFGMVTVGMEDDDEVRRT